MAAVTMRQDVEAIAFKGGRPCGSEGHGVARAYLLRRMHDWALEVYAGKNFELPYTVKGQPFCNIVGVLPGTRRDLAPVFAGRDTASLWVHSVDHHPNGKAHGLAAGAIAEWLRTIPGFLPR